MTTEKKTSSPWQNPITAPTQDPSVTFVNKRQQILDIHKLLLAVAELQARVIELEKANATARLLNKERTLKEGYGGFVQRGDADVRPGV